MIWNLCLILALVGLLALIKLTFDKRFGRLRILYVMIGCAVIAYVLYLPLMLQEHGASAGLLGGVINMLRVISLDADYLANCSAIGQAVDSNLIKNLYYILLALIHVLLPAVSAMTAVTLIMQCIAELQLRMLKKSKKTAYVFSQHNDRSEALARDIYSNNKKCELLFLDDPEKAELANLLEEMHCSVIKERISSVKVHSKNRRVYYYCICDDQEENLNAALDILGQLKDEPAAVQRNTHLYIFTTDPAAEMIVDSVQKGFVNISIIDENRIAAYRLLTDYPLAKYAVDKKIKVLLCGFTGMAQMLLRSVAWCGQLFGYSLEVTVIAKDPQEQTFRAEYPGLFTQRYSIRFLDAQNETEFYEKLNSHCRDYNYIIVAEDSAEKTLDKAVKLRRFFYRVGDTFDNAPPIFAHIENDARAAAVAMLQTAEAKPERRMSYGIIPFGVVKQTYSYKNITGSDLEILSKNVHLVYEDIFSDGPIDVDGALERYNLFEVNKNSNRANALHIRYKLLMLGLDYTDDPDAEEVELSDYLSPETLEDLTYAEHDRWMAFLETEGWEESNIPQANAYKASGISKGRHNCPLLKLHPYICPFEDLAQRSEDLGLPDSTVYDRDLISRIPDILHDKWNISDKKYKIIKRQE